MNPLAAAALASFVVSLCLVPLCRRAATRLGCVAASREDRWHRHPTPMLGGVAIALAVAVVHTIVAGPRSLPILGIGAAAIFFVGLVDDLVTLKPYTKLVAEIAVASLFVWYGYRLSWSASLTLDTVLTMIWIVGLTNALNLLDNMDGLAAGIGLIAGISLIASFLVNGGSTEEVTYLAVLLGAIAGFLIYNIHPASVFMGDSGSLFVGLNLAVLTLGSPDDSHGRANVLSIVAGPVLILLIPILDTTLVTVMRLLSGRSAAQGGRDHSSHRLVAMGLSERSAVSVLWTLAALGGLLALALSGYHNDLSSIAAAAFILTMIAFAIFLARVRVYADADEALLSSGRITPFPFEFMYKKRVGEVVVDGLLCAVAYYAAYRLRFDRVELQTYFRTFLMSLPLVVGVQTLALFGAGGYQGIWRYFGLADGVTFAKGIALGTIVSVMLIRALYPLEPISLSVFAIHAAILMLLVCAWRAAVRLTVEAVERRRGGGRRVVVYGTGDVAASALRDLLRREPTRYRILGFINDDSALAHGRLQGYPVLGDFSFLTTLVAGGGVDDVVITLGEAEDERLLELESLCRTHRVSLLRLHVQLDALVVPS